MYSVCNYYYCFGTLFEFANTSYDFRSQTARGGVNVVTDWQLTSVTSKLTLITASSSDNGVYSCTVPGSGTDKVTLFIDEGEYSIGGGHYYQGDRKDDTEIRCSFK